MRKIIFIAMLLLQTTANAQVLALDECKQLAHDNYPAIKQYDLIEQTGSFTIENAKKAWLPQISASINGMAFTDVLNMNSQMEQMGIDIKNMMASGSITVNQNIYDGGQTKAQNKVTSAQTEMKKQQLNVSMYDLNQRIEQLYFGILTLDEQITQTILLQKDLALSNSTVSSMMKGGIANQSDLDNIKVEQLKAMQSLDAQKASRTAYLKMLGIFIGKQLNGSTTLQKPAFVECGSSNARPELDYYQSQSKLIDAQRNQLDSKLMPRLSAFGMGTYHTKVTDLIKSGLLAGGVTLSWNIGALYTRKSDIRKLELQRQQVESQRETFLFNNSLQNESTNGNIESLKQQISRDGEIVSLRESIRSKSEKKVELGTESVNEMLRDINAVSQARQQKALHELQLLKEIYSLKTNNNN